MGQLLSKTLPFDETDHPSNYASEHARLETFSHWTHEYVTKEKLARFGFYFERQPDVVKCNFCKVEIGNWDIGDDPLREHKRWAPQCPLLMKRPTDNIPFDQNLLDQSLSVNADECGLRRQSSEINHPDYSAYNNRLESFVNWPISVRQRPDELADAGFFYIGTGDRVKCFACGGGLKDWQIDDIPWDEHALWYGDECMYVKHSRGEDFVKRIKERYELKKQQNNILVTSTEPVVNDAVFVANNNQFCKICYVNDVDTIFMPCMHVVACGNCAFMLKDCPMCRKPISKRQRIYFS